METNNVVQKDVPILVPKDVVILKGKKAQICRIRNGILAQESREGSDFCVFVDAIF
jgi:hypothetical protein